MSKSNDNLTFTEKILSDLKKRYGFRTDLELAEKLGYSSTGTLSAWKRRDTINLKRIRDHCPDVDLSELAKPYHNTDKGLTEDEKRAIDLVKKYERHATESGVSKKERDLLLEFLSRQADSLAEGLRLLQRLREFDK